jgi:DHA3 family macrolide efflux protein-like MFS transporter
MNEKMEIHNASIPRSVYVFLATRALSAFGSSMTAFAINVWVFEKTRSFTLFAVLTLLTSLPNLLLAPIVGIVVDRYNKKYLLMACEATTAATVLFALVAFVADTFGLLQAALVVLALSIASNFRWTLIGASIGTLVPREHLNRINGIQQSFEGVIDIGAPLLGAAALHALGPGWIFVFDIGASAIALAALFILDGRLLVPKNQHSLATGFLRNALVGVQWIMRHRDLRRLLFFITFYNLAGGVFTVSLIPHFLSFAGKESLGVALALEGAGALLGGLLIARMKYSLDRSETVVYTCAATFGIVMTLWGGVNNDIAAFIALFFSGAVVSALIASLQTTWQANVPSDLQGRVFAARRMISYSLIPVATLLSIPFASQVTAPLLALHPMLQAIWGTGESGGLAMLLSLLGALLVPASTIAILRARNALALPITIKGD